LTDIVTVCLSGFVAYFGYFGFTNSIDERFIAAILAMIVSQFGINTIFGLYSIPRGEKPINYLMKYVASFAVSFFILIALAFLLKISSQFSRVWFASWAALTPALGLTLRATAATLAGHLHKKGINRQMIAIIGTGPSAQNTINKINNSPLLGFEVVDVLAVTEAGHAINPTASLEDLETIANDKKFDQIWICLETDELNKLAELRKSLTKIAAAVRFVPSLTDFALFNHKASDIAGIPVIDLTSNPMELPTNRLLKDIEDKVLASVILMLISPLMVLIAIAVKITSRGPVFYKQERVSWNGKTFQMLKFRSMSVDSEKNGVVWGGSQTMSVTPIGKFLRRTSLDELPQFINVLLGDMSIVGPRPERTVFVDQFKNEIPGYMHKHLVKAGITGLAQIEGWRGDTDLKKRIESDLKYIQSWSLWLDIKIILLTLFKGLVAKNAY
jgi:putative colanic acid biosynthesis UDP-glucose lipid carrier transferase